MLLVRDILLKDFAADDNSDLLIHWNENLSDLHGERNSARCATFPKCSFTKIWKN